MTDKNKKLCLCIVVLGFLTPTAQGGEQDPRIQALLQKLETRDRIIADLQRRVSQLEKIVGSKGTKTSSVARTGTAPPPHHTPPLGPPPAAKKREVILEVDEEATERALERTLTQVGALLLTPGRAEIQPFFTYSRVETNVPFLVNINNDLATLHQKVRANQFDMGIFTRWGLPFDAQLELSLPYTIADRTRVDNLSPAGGTLSQSLSRSVSRLADVRLGVAKTVFREKGWRPDLIARLTWVAPTGRWQADQVFLGGGFHRLRGSLTVLKRQDPLAFSGSFFYEGAFDERGDNPGDRYGFNVGAFLASSPETSLQIALNQVFVDELKVNGHTIRGSDRVISSFVIGASTILAKGVLLSISGGIGLTDDSPDYFVNISMPWRFSLPLPR